MVFNRPIHLSCLLFFTYTSCYGHVMHYNSLNTKKEFEPSAIQILSAHQNPPAHSFFLTHSEKPLAGLKPEHRNLTENETRYTLKKNNIVLSSRTKVKPGRTIQIKSPEPGNYTIEIEIIGPEKIWQQTVRYHLTIMPMWWQSWWVNGLKWLLIPGICALLFYNYLRRKEKIKYYKLKEALLANELESHVLFAKMKPHFIFNALIPFQDMTINGDRDGALKYINTFSKLMRGLLKNSKEKKVALKEELNFIQNYLEVQKNLHNDSFDAIIAVAPEILQSDISIPALLIQPLIENAIEHGLQNLAYRGMVKLEITSNNNEITIIITDNGHGFTPKAIYENHALNIIEERLLLIKKLTGTGNLTLRNQNGKSGTIASITLPNIISS